MCSQNIFDRDSAATAVLAFTLREEGGRFARIASVQCIVWQNEIGNEKYKSMDIENSTPTIARPQATTADISQTNS